jgi:hypothetical protein
MKKKSESKKSEKKEMKHAAHAKEAHKMHKEILKHHSKLMGAHAKMEKHLAKMAGGGNAGGAQISSGKPSERSKPDKAGEIAMAMGRGKRNSSNAL